MHLESSKQSAGPWAHPPTTLRPKGAVNSSNVTTHVGAFTKGNAGDHLLSVVLRDLFDYANGATGWQLRHVRPEFRASDIDIINQGRGVVIGGGGLFLRDTNTNPNSGWQWNCSISNLLAIKVPLVLFAVGYNRFRDQADFDPVFSDHIAATAEKSVYIGLRNHGSIRAIKQYIPDSLHGKIRYQPCMTTLLRFLYPDIGDHAPVKGAMPVVALNMAFDRPHSRFKGHELKILISVARAASVISKKYTLHVVAHGRDDLHILPFLRGYNVAFEVVDLRVLEPGEIVKYYSGVSLAIGMRGHSQMIPFGCGTPILSLISHDKLKWFLEDIGHLEWGVEVSSPRLRDDIVNKVETILAEEENVRERIVHAQAQLWETSLANAKEFGRAVSASLSADPIAGELHHSTESARPSRQKHAAAMIRHPKRILLARYHDGSAKPNWGGRATSLALRRLVEGSSLCKLSGLINGSRIVSGFEAPTSLGPGLKACLPLPFSIPAREHAAALLENAYSHPDFAKIRDDILIADAFVMNGEGDFILRPRVTLWRSLVLMEAASLLGKEVHLVNSILSADEDGQIDPLVSLRVGETLSRCSKIVFRDPQSLALCCQLYPKLPHRCYLPDALFAFPKRFRKVSVAGHAGAELLDKLPRQPFIAVSGSSAARLARRYAAGKLHSFLNGILATGTPVVVVATDAGDAWMEAGAKAANVLYTPPEIALETGAAILARAKLFFSGRYHPSILASLVGVPSLFMRSNSHKTRSLQTMLGNDVPRELPFFSDASAVETIMPALSGWLTEAPAPWQQALPETVAALARSARQLPDIIAE